MKYTFNTWSEKEKRLVFYEAPNSKSEASSESPEVNANQEAAKRSNEAHNAIEGKFNTEKENQLFKREGEKYEEAEDNWKALKTGKTDGVGKQFIYCRDTIANHDSNGPRVAVLLAYTPHAGFQVMHSDARKWIPLTDDALLRKYESVKNNYSSILDDNDENKNKLNQNKYNTSIEESCLKAKTGALEWFDNNHENKEWGGINAGIKTALDASLQLPSALRSPVDTPASAPKTKPTEALNQNENSGLKIAFDQLDRAENREEQIKALVKIVVEIQKLLKDLGYNSEEKKEEPVTKPEEKKEEEKKPETNASKKPAADRVVSQLEEMKEEKDFNVRVAVLDNQQSFKKSDRLNKLAEQDKELKRQETVLQEIQKNDETDDTPQKIKQTSALINTQMEKINTIKKEKEDTKNTIQDIEEDQKIVKKIQKFIGDKTSVQKFKFIKDQSSEQLLKVGDDFINLSKDDSLSAESKTEVPNLVDKAKKYAEQLQKLVTEKLWISNDKNAIRIKNAIQISQSDNEFEIRIDKQAILNAVEDIAGANVKNITNWLNAELKTFTENTEKKGVFILKIDGKTLDFFLKKLSVLDPIANPKSNTNTYANNFRKNLGLK